MTKLMGVQSGIGSFEDLLKATYDLSTELKRMLNTGLVIADNLDGVFVDVADTGISGTSFTVTHGLGRSPTGYFVSNIDKAGVVYTSGSDLGTASGSNFKCSVSNAALTLFIF